MVLEVGQLSLPAAITDTVDAVTQSSILLDAQIDLAPMTSLLMQLCMVLIGIAFFMGFSIKKFMQLLNKF